jgi:putative addiction module component (TIGR02574 family)
MNVNDIEHLTVTERLQTMEAIWDSLISDRDVNISSPAWHEEVLQKRLDKVKSGEASFVSLDDVKRQFKK